MCNALKRAGIIGTGSMVSENVLTNFDLEKMVDTTNDWIIQRTGISERRILEKNVPLYKLAAQAAKKALEDAKLEAEDLDLIVCATITGDYITPSMSCLVQAEIGARKAVAFDVNAACTGFIYSLTIAEQFIKNGVYKNILVIGSESLSRITDWEDRNTCVLFGDGAGAAILSEVEEDYGIISTYLGADGSQGKCLTAPSFYATEEDLEKRQHENKRVIWMDGSEVFKFAVKIMENATLRVLEEAGKTIDDIKLIIPHQANKRIIEGAQKRLRISDEKIFTNLQKYGNMSSASVAIALDEAVRSKTILKGDNIVLVGFGGGLTWGSILMRHCR